MIGVKIYMDFTRPGPAVKLKWFSTLIRMVQKTPYSHVLLRWHSPNVGIEARYEASGNRLKFMGPIASKDHYTVIKTYEFHITKEEYRKLISFCQLYAGVEYGKLQVLGIGIAGWLGLKKNPFSQGRKSQVCSEVAGWFLRDVCGYSVNDIDLDLAGPKQIDEYLQEIGAHLVK